jgi:hypothetical protein
MSSFRVLLTSFAVLILLTASASLAHAQSIRTWVSGGGDDAAPCSHTAPCKTFAGAISKTLAGGEISVINAGSYGAVTIDKAITINGNGTLASVLAQSGPAITVQAGATDVVTLKDLNINGVGQANNGIRYLSGKALNVLHTWISGFKFRGIDASLTDSGQLFTDEVTISNCQDGIRTTTTTNFLFAVINRTQITGMTGDGVDVQTGSRVTIRDSVMSLNADEGINITSTTGNAGLNLENTLLDKNSIGLTQNNPGGNVQISGVMITNNNTGINNLAGSVVSFGNNRVGGNAVNGAPTSTPGQI